MDAETAERIERARQADQAAAEWRALPCPSCGRRPYTRERHVFITGNYACRRPGWAPHRHYERKCAGCGDVQFHPERDALCVFVGIG